MQKQQLGLLAQCSRVRVNAAAQEPGFNARLPAPAAWPKRCKQSRISPNASNSLAEIAERLLAGARAHGWQLDDQTVVLIQRLSAI
jgi:hypothetical protein